MNDTRFDAWQHRADLEQIHEYEHAMILNPGPNVSHTCQNGRDQADRVLLLVAVVLGLLAIYL